MREALCHWFRITRDQEIELWRSGIFSFDASVLLNIYAYSNETRNKLVQLIEGNAERIRLPHQFGLEYARGRSNTILKQVNNYLKADKVLGDFENNIASKRDHPYLSESSLQALSEIRNDLAARRKEIEGLFGSDSYADKILDAFEGRLGPSPSQDDLTKLHEQARVRYDAKRPPGYIDLKDKNVPDAYGDYIGWSQLIQIAKSEQRGVIFVTDDQKEDWWLIEKERTIGPRPELLEEFKDLSNQRVWIYTSENFLRAAKDLSELEIQDEIIEEVSLRLESQRNSERTENLKSSQIRFTLEKDNSSSADSEKSTGNDASAINNEVSPTKSMGSGLQDVELASKKTSEG